MNEDVPSNVQGGGWGDIFNRIFSCLKRRSIIAGSGILATPTKDGIKLSTEAGMGQVIWIKACLTDGTECYVPVRVAGNPRRTVGAAEYDDATVEEEDIPDGSILID